MQKSTEKKHDQMPSLPVPSAHAAHRIPVGTNKGAAISMHKY